MVRLKRKGTIKHHIYNSATKHILTNKRTKEIIQQNAIILQVLYKIKHFHALKIQLLQTT